MPLGTPRRSPSGMPAVALHATVGAGRVSHAALSSRRFTAAPVASAPRARAVRARRVAMATAEGVPSFEFASANRIIFGRGEALKKVPAFAKSCGGTSALLVVGSSTARAQPFADALKALGLKTAFFTIGACRARRRQPGHS